MSRCAFPSSDLGAASVSLPTIVTGISLPKFAARNPPFPGAVGPSGSIEVASPLPPVPPLPGASLTPPSTAARVPPFPGAAGPSGSLSADLPSPPLALPPGTFSLPIPTVAVKTCPLDLADAVA